MTRGGGAAPPPPSGLNFSFYNSPKPPSNMLTFPPISKTPALTSSDWEPSYLEFQIPSTGYGCCPPGAGERCCIFDKINGSARPTSGASGVGPCPIPRYPAVAEHEGGNAQGGRVLAELSLPHPLSPKTITTGQARTPYGRNPWMDDIMN